MTDKDSVSNHAYEGRAEGLWRDPFRACPLEEPSYKGSHGTWELRIGAADELVCPKIGDKNEIGDSWVFSIGTARVKKSPT